MLGLQFRTSLFSFIESSAPLVLHVISQGDDLLQVSQWRGIILSVRWVCGFFNLRVRRIMPVQKSRIVSNNFIIEERLNEKRYKILLDSWIDCVWADESVHFIALGYWALISPCLPRIMIELMKFGANKVFNSVERRCGSTSLSTKVWARKFSSCIMIQYMVFSGVVRTSSDLFCPTWSNALSPRSSVASSF